MCFYSKSSLATCNEFYSKLSKHGRFLNGWVSRGSGCFSGENLNFECCPRHAPSAQRTPVAFCAWAAMYEAVNQLSWINTHLRETPWGFYKCLSEVFKAAGQVCDEVRTATLSEFWLLAFAQAVWIYLGKLLKLQFDDLITGIQHTTIVTTMLCDLGTTTTTTWN